MKKKTGKIAALASVFAALSSLWMTAFADDMDAAAAQIASMVGKFTSFIADAFVVVGIMIVVYAVSQFALAFKDDNPEQKSRGTIMLVVGIILIFIKTFAKAILNAAGVPADQYLERGFLNAGGGGG